MTLVMNFIRYHKLKVLFVLILLVDFTFSSYSQEAEKISPYLTLQYFKDTDNHRFLQTTLTYSKNRMEIPIKGMDISFSEGPGSGKLLGNVVTDNKGIARFSLEDNISIPVNSEGLWDFSTGYNGNDTIEAATSDITVKDVKLEMKLSEVDSVKTITISATTHDKGKELPVSGEQVLVYVPRMFSLLQVGDVTLDDNGTGSFAFPTDLPGDDAGNLKIIAKFEDNPTYGNVEKNVVEMWGLPKDLSAPDAHRALWTKSPPMWMIITLSVLLMGVWGHYLFAVISLVMIKLEAKRKKAREDYRL